MGALDDALGRYDDHLTEYERWVEERATEHERDQELSRQLGPDFLRQVARLGLRPDKTVYDVAYQQRSLSEGQWLRDFGMSEDPKEVSRRAAFEVYNLGGNQPEFWISTNGNRVVVEKADVVNVHHRPLLGSLQRYTERCRETPLSIHDEVRSYKPGDETTMRTPIADAMAAYLRRRSR